MARFSSSVKRPVERVVKPQVVGGDERPGLASPLPDYIAQRPVEQVGAGVVAHRVGPSLGVDDGLDRLADAQPAVERAALDDQAADRLLRIGHGEQLAAATRFADRALVADLPAALRVERRAVEHDFGRPVPGQLIEFHAVAHDRHDATLGRRRLVAQELGVAVATLDGAVQRGQLRVPGKVGLLARTAALTLLGEGVLEPREIDGEPVFRGELDGQVDREPVGIVEPEGDVAVEDGRIARQVLRPAPDDALGRRAAERLADGLVEQLRAGVQGAGELGFLALDRGQDHVALLGQVRIGLGHGVDHDGRRLGHERLAPSQQPAVANGSTQDAAQDVAPPLIARKDVISDEERDGAGVVRDDLVAEALLLEGIRVVPEQLLHPGVDRREQVGVVVGRDLLEDAREALETHPGVDAGGRQRDQGAVGLEVELHEDQVPDLEPARALLAVIGHAMRALAEVLARGRSGSRCTARTARRRPCATSSSRRPWGNRPSGRGAPRAGRSRRARPRRRGRPSCRSWLRAVRRGCPGRASGSPTRSGSPRA